MATEDNWIRNNYYEKILPEFIGKIYHLNTSDEIMHMLPTKLPKASWGKMVMITACSRFVYRNREKLPNTSSLNTYLRVSILIEEKTYKFIITEHVFDRLFEEIG